tara:strand:+ start:1479 stop:1658 length:180 start_codon:yes stop_codon:yes gene_type:complete
MNLSEIKKAPKQHGIQMCKQGMSIHANPFRNTNGYPKEHALWIEGYQEEVKRRVKRLEK